MANARAIVKRRKAVRNIRKITQTMQLIATARYQKCLQRATATKPYTEKISEMIQAVVGTDAVQRLLKSISEASDDSSGEGPQDSKMKTLRVLQPNEGVDRSIMIVFTSNRGLCGAYNASVLRTAREHKNKLSAEGITPSIEMFGKKGISYFRFLGEPVASGTTDVEDRIAFSRVGEMADRLIDEYVSGRIARVDVAYMQFHSVGVQKPMVAQLLPIEPPKVEAGSQTGPAADFEFSPPPEQLLTRLVPETIKIRLFQYFNDAIVSEQVSRMIAMKAATDAAGDMITFLSRQYNRARQSQITLELLDIMGGVEALK